MTLTTSTRVWIASLRLCGTPYPWTRWAFYSTLGPGLHGRCPRWTAAAYIRYLRQMLELGITDLYGDTTGSDFDSVAEAAEQGVNNPLPEEFVGDFAGHTKAHHSPYSLFLGAVRLGSGPEYAMNYEPFFLDALMSRNPEVLRDVQDQWRASAEGHEEEVYVLLCRGGLGPAIYQPLPPQ